jgi:hypothetical protein
MAPKTKKDKPASALTVEDLERLIPMLDEVDSVELKLTVPATDQRKVVNALALDPLDAVIRQVFFFDTPDLTLFENGLVVRARRTQGRVDDSTVKLRPVVPSDMPAALRAQPDFAIEVDAMPGGFVCSASYKGQLTNTAVREVLMSGKPLRKLFSKPQREFFSAHAPDGISIDDLAILGPITVFRLKALPEGFGRKLVGELWEYPDGSRVVELSTKCEPGTVFDVAARSRTFLGGRGVDLSAEQQTKTRTALEFFAGQAGNTVATEVSNGAGDS